MSDSAQQLFPKHRMAVRARHDQIGTHLMCFSLQRVGDRSCRNLKELDPLHGSSGMAAQMFNDAVRRQGPVSVYEFGWIKCDYRGLLGTLDEW